MGAARSATPTTSSSTARRTQARQHADPAIIDYIIGALAAATAETRHSARRFVQLVQQLTGPAAAKGVEDTALYLYVPLLSRNEVGGAPDEPLTGAVERFHSANAERAAAGR